jgi:hypothetical protein
MRNVALAVSMCVLVALIGPAARAVGALERQLDGLPLRLGATIVNATGLGDGRNAEGVITITRWTTPAERDSLGAALTRGGTTALLFRLLDVPSHGQIRIPGWQGPDPHKMRLGWDLRYAWRETDPAGAQRIVIGTDRYISFWEAHDDPKSTEYPFTMIELRLDNNGEGIGKADVAARIKITDDNVLELENYHTAPELLLTVKVQK